MNPHSTESSPIVANELNKNAVHMQNTIYLDAKWQQEVTNATYKLHERCVVLPDIVLEGKEGECRGSDMRII